MATNDNPTPATRTVSILGAHGQIGRIITRLLTAEGHTVQGLIRNPDQSDDIRADGGEPVICDLETATSSSLDTHLAGSDTVIFAAGAGPNSGPERKRTLDRDGAIKAVESAVRVGVDHFVIISSMGADQPPTDNETFSVYLRAKAAADKAVVESRVDHTVIRPGGLTDDDATGLVTAEASTGRGKIPRADVAAVVATVVGNAEPKGVTFELIGGTTPITDALDSLT